MYLLSATTIFFFFLSKQRNEKMHINILNCYFSNRNTNPTFIYKKNNKKKKTPKVCIIKLLTKN